MPETHYKIIATWIIGTYIHSQFNTYPFLFLNAMKGSGKTRLLKLISHLAKGSNGEVHTGITEAVLFRSEQGSTLVLDECEAIASKEKATLREYLNASYKKGGTVNRAKKIKDNKGEGYVIEKFKPFRPIAMANIQGMDDVLGDRCITLILDKSDNESFTALIEDFDENPEIIKIKDRLNELTMSLCCLVSLKGIHKQWNNYIKDRTTNNITTYINITTLNNITTRDLLLEEHFNKIFEAKIFGRNLELSFPLFLTTLIFYEHLFYEMIEILKEVMIIKKNDEFIENKDISLIDFVSKQEGKRFDFISLAAIVRQFREHLGEQEDEDRWINPKWMGRALKRLNLICQSKRKTAGKEIMLNVDKAKEKIKMFKNVEKDEPSS